MANEILGLVDKTTGAGVPNADSRYAISGGSSPLVGFTNLSQFELSLIQAGSGTNPTQYDVVKIKRTSTNGITYTCSDKLMTILSGGVLGDVLNTDYIEVVVGQNNDPVQERGESHSNGCYLVYIDTDCTFKCRTDGDLNQEEIVSVAAVRWRSDQSASERSILVYRPATTSITGRDRYWKHYYQGSEVKSGGTPSGFTTQPASPTDADNYIGISECIMDTSDVTLTLAELVKPSGSGSNYAVFHRDGSGTNTWTYNLGANLPVLPGSVGTYVGYDSDSGATGLTDCSNNYFVNYYLLYTPCKSLSGSNNGPARFIWIPGQAQYSTLSGALSESPLSLNLSGFINDVTRGMIVGYKFTLGAKSNYSTTYKYRIESHAKVNLSLNTLATVSATEASGVSYDNTSSGLASSNVQGAIDELATDTSSNVFTAIVDGSGGANPYDYTSLDTALAGFDANVHREIKLVLRGTPTASTTVRTLHVPMTVINDGDSKAQFYVAASLSTSSVVKFVNVQLYGTSSLSVINKGRYEFDGCQIDNSLGVSNEIIRISGTHASQYDYALIANNCEFTSVSGNTCIQITNGTSTNLSMIFNDCSFSGAGRFLDADFSNTTDTIDLVVRNTNIPSSKLVIASGIMNVKYDKQSTISSTQVVSGTLNLIPEGWVKLDSSEFQNQAGYNVSEWQASTSYSLGDLVRSSDTADNNIYKCVVAGQSGSGEPTWSTTRGTTTTDNAATWMAIGAYTISTTVDKSAVITPGTIMKMISNTGSTMYGVVYSITSSLITLLCESLTARESGLSRVFYYKDSSAVVAMPWDIPGNWADGLVDDLIESDRSTICNYPLSQARIVGISFFELTVNGSPEINVTAGGTSNSLLYDDMIVPVSSSPAYSFGMINPSNTVVSFLERIRIPVKTSVATGNADLTVTIWLVPENLT